MFADTDLSRDAFLCGRLHLWQPVRGYRAATDPVLLAACVDAKAGQRVLDLGCGAGAASLCLAARVPGLVQAGLELQPAYAGLARRNAADNGVALEVVEGDVAAMPAVLRREFDHVIANPPYYPAGGTPSPDVGRATALQVGTPITAWVEAGLRRLAPGGVLTLIISVDLLPMVLGLVPQAVVLPL
ncbi:MAG: methyltransferase, partial [Rhodobacteraceae bacterium]|nr:methyltransferase [Paracoccaceae bacterium]